jgi:hypothetical protein
MDSESVVQKAGWLEMMTAVYWAELLVGNLETRLVDSTVFQKVVMLDLQ